MHKFTTDLITETNIERHRSTLRDYLTDESSSTVCLY